MRAVNLDASKTCAFSSLAEVERVRATGSNYFGRKRRIMSVEGSLWAAFSKGFESGGGKSPFA